MAKKKKDELPEDGDIKPKKKGLFSFLRRKSKPQNEQVEVPQDDAVSDDKLADAEKPKRKQTASTKKTTTRKTASKKKTATDADKVAPKKHARAKKKTTEQPEVSGVEATDEESQKKKKRRFFGFLKRKQRPAEEDVAPESKDKKSEPAKKKPASGRAADADKAPAKKRGRPKKNVEDTKIAASETAEDLADEPKKKKVLFGFLKRTKKADKNEEQIEGTSVAKEEVVDISVPPVGGDILQMNVDPIPDADEVPKKKFGFLTKKVILIIIALCGVSGATGAAAIVFAGPLLGNDPSKGLACKVAHKTDFTLMQEKRVTAFIRADLLPPRQRIEMLLSYTKFLESEYSDANLFTVSLIDTEGPKSRKKFRGDSVGAQVVYAPQPLMSMATDTQWEVRYVNVNETFGGRFMGHRFTLSDDEINEFNNDQLMASDCYLDKTEEELAAEELAEEEAETLAAMADEEGAQVDGDAANDMESAEPGFIDNVLGMVGLGGEDQSSEEMHNKDLLQAYPGDGRANADVMYEEPGFIDGILSMVGLGGRDADADKIPGVLGTRVKYN